MFKTRLLSGIVLVAVLILTVGMGGPVLYTVLLAASLIGLMELYRTVKVQNQALGVVGYLGAIGYYILMYQNGIYNAAYHPSIDACDGSVCICIS